MNYDRIFLLMLTSISFFGKISANQTQIPAAPSMNNQFEDVTESKEFRQMIEVLSYLSDLHQYEREKFYGKYREEIGWIKDNYETNKVECETFLIAIIREFENIINNTINNKAYSELTAMNIAYDEEQKKRACTSDRISVSCRIDL